MACFNCEANEGDARRVIIFVGIKNKMSYLWLELEISSGYSHATTHNNKLVEL